MESSESIAKLSAAFVLAQADLPDVPKNHEGQAGQRRYAYADLGDIIKAIRPILAKHGLAIFQSVGSVDAGSITIATTLMHSSGEWIDSDTLVLQGGTPQQAGSAITYGKRYSLAAALGLVTDEDDDGAGASKPRARKGVARATDDVFASEAQRKMLFAVAHARARTFGDDLTGEEILRAVLTKRGIDSGKKIPMRDVDAIKAECEGWDVPTGGEA